MITSYLLKKSLCENDIISLQWIHKTYKCLIDFHGHFQSSLAISSLLVVDDDDDDDVDKVDFRLLKNQMEIISRG